MGKSAPKAPRAPDPVRTAAAQAVYDRNAAIDSAALNAVNSVTPWGTVTATGPQVVGGSIVSGGTRNVSLNPQDQALLNAQRSTALSLVPQVSQALNTPVDLEGIQNQYMARFQPQFDQQRETLRTQLVNTGFTPGSKAYDLAMDEANRRENDVRMAGMNNAVNLASALRQMPISNLQSVMGLQPQAPQVMGGTGAQVSSPDFSGLVNQQYNTDLMNWEQRVKQRQANQGALFGRGTLLGMM